MTHLSFVRGIHKRLQATNGSAANAALPRLSAKRAGAKISYLHTFINRYGCERRSAPWRAPGRAPRHLFSTNMIPYHCAQHGALLRPRGGCFLSWWHHWRNNASFHSAGSYGLRAWTLFLYGFGLDFMPWRGALRLCAAHLPHAASAGLANLPLRMAWHGPKLFYWIVGNTT